LQIDSGAAVNLTGAYAANNINREFAGLTGAGVLYGEGGTVTINKASDTDIFSGDIQGAQGLIKSGAGTLALGGASSYTGTTMVNEGRLVVAHADALGATSGGTIVASGAQLRINSLADTVFPAEPLIISGQGLPSGGALRNATNNNIWQGAIALAANATIGAASGTTLTLAAASGATLNLGAYDLVVDGAGTVQVSGGIAGSGQISKTGSGQLIISNSVLVATIQSNSVSLDFATPPADGPYAVLSGPLDSASLATTPSVTGLPGGATATLTNNPNLIVIVSSGAPTNQKPVVDSGLGFSISENPAIGTPVGSLTATDADSDPLSGWTIVSGNEDGAFALDSATGELTVAGILDHETAASYTLEVSVSDGKEASDSAMVSVSVVNVPEFADMFGSADPAADANGDGISNLMAYALGASASNATVSRPVTTVNSSNLTITALVRTNDPAVQVRGSATTNLASWTNAPIVGTPASDQTGAVSGVTQKQEFTVERGTDPKKFLRLKATLQP
jgi:autotransporter-associated beta strand protein